jgi:phage gp37-like protein
MIASHGGERDVEVAIEKIDTYRAVYVMFRGVIVIAQWGDRHGNRL